jgi:hypothetical protein
VSVSKKKQVNQLNTSTFSQSKDLQSINGVTLPSNSSWLVGSTAVAFVATLHHEFNLLSNEVDDKIATVVIDKAIVKNLKHLLTNSGNVESDHEMHSESNHSTDNKTKQRDYSQSTSCSLNALGQKVPERSSCCLGSLLGFANSFHNLSHCSPAAKQHDVTQRLLHKYQQLDFVPKHSNLATTTDVALDLACCVPALEQDNQAVSLSISFDPTTQFPSSATNSSEMQSEMYPSDEQSALDKLHQQLRRTSPAVELLNAQCAVPLQGVLHEGLLSEH